MGFCVQHNYSQRKICMSAQHNHKQPEQDDVSVHHLHHFQTVPLCLVSVCKPHKTCQTNFHILDVLQKQQTLLFRAVVKNNLDIATLLIDQGAVIDACDSVSAKQDCTDVGFVIKEPVWDTYVLIQTTPCNIRMKCNNQSCDSISTHQKQIPIARVQVSAYLSKHTMQLTSEFIMTFSPSISCKTCCSTLSNVGVLDHSDCVAECFCLAVLIMLRSTCPNSEKCTDQ